MKRRKCYNDKEPINFQDQIKEILVCKFCSFETENIDELDSHIQSHEERCEDEDIDDELEDVIVLVQDLPPPKKRSKKEVPDSYKCPHCKYETKRKHDLPKHLLTHSTIESTTIYKCSQCPYETKRKNDMPKHMLAHCTNVQMFRCPECPYQTKRKSDLPKHLLCHKPSGEVPLYKCDYCEYVTKRKGDLPKHVLNHKDAANLKLFNCSECHYKTKRKNDLHKHMLVHCDRHVAGVFKCLKCMYATDKVNKFSKHILSDCKYCHDAINIEHLMLEDIIGTVDEENVMIEGEEVEMEEYEEELPYMEEEKVAEENQANEEHERPDCSNYVETNYVGYKLKDEVSKEKYWESVRRKHGVFKINLGEFSYENQPQNDNQEDHVKEDEYSIEEVVS